MKRPGNFFESRPDIESKIEKKFCILHDRGPRREVKFVSENASRRIFLDE